MTKYLPAFLSATPLRILRPPSPLLPVTHASSPSHSPPHSPRFASRAFATAANTSTTAGPEAEPRRSPRLIDVVYKKVYKSNGKLVKNVYNRPERFTETIELGQADIELPMSLVPNLNNLWPRRLSRALVLGNSDRVYFRAKDWLTPDARVVIFVHGLTQAPLNYRSILQHFAALGYIVLAPEASLLDVMFPWQLVETVRSRWASPFVKLQYALTIDAARCVHLAKDYGVKEVHMIGHGLGGTSCLMYAFSKTPYSVNSEDMNDDLSSLSLLAPFLSSVLYDGMPYPVGPRICDGADMKDPFDINLDDETDQLAHVPTLIVHGERDTFTPVADSRALYGRLLRNGKEGYLGLATFQKGFHVGFEDTLEISIPKVSSKFAQFVKILFIIIDLILFKMDFFRTGVRDQLQGTKEMMNAIVMNCEKGRNEINSLVRSNVQPFDANLTQSGEQHTTTDIPARNPTTISKNKVKE